MDDASYVQQSWEDQGVHNEQIKEILTQFSNTQELLKLQMNIFGVSEKHLDPHLHTPNLAVLSVNSNNGKKETGKRVERSNDTAQPASKKKKVEVSDNDQVTAAKTAQNHVLNERQRRLKMNQKIQSLKELLPKSCADILSNKLAILHESVQHIKNLHILVEQLNERNHYLEQRLATVEKELTIFHTNIINNNNNAMSNMNNNNNMNPATPSNNMNNSSNNNSNHNSNNNSSNNNNPNNNGNNSNNNGANIAPLSVDPMALQYNSYSPQYSSSQFPISHANPAHFYHSNSNFSLY